jgi:hypothetical protein
MINQSRRLLRILFAASIAFSPFVPVMATEADIVNVRVTQTSPGVYRFTVAVVHDDIGWKHYANKWDVVAPDGTVLGTRELLHPHVHEQPFTRSLSGVKIPDGIGRVTLRAHDFVHGYGGKEKMVDLPR